MTSEEQVRPDQPAVRDSLLAIRNFLAQHSTLTLATVSAEGHPMAASLFFAEDDDLNLYWVSGVGSRHSLNLSANPSAAVTVHRATWSWREIAGVQMEGEVAALRAGAETAAAWDRYRAKFPFVGEFEAEVARSTFYCFQPRWARWLDNAQGFGHKEEVTL
jgi:uncharacterized protein YhbP (UPF0306 family)